MHCPKSIANFLGALAVVLMVRPVVHAAPKYKILHAFNPKTEGYVPGPLALGPGGGLYGPLGAGPFDDGSVFELAPGAHGWALSLLYSFPNSRRDGGGPVGKPLFDKVGAIYGTADGGGSSDAGVVFKLGPGPDPWSETVLYDFCSLNNCDDGGAPWAGLVWDNFGNLYGTTYGGGPNTGAGVVFELAPADGGWTEGVLYSFHPNSKGNSDGYGPKTPVTFDALGNLYGTTEQGGDFNCGGSGCGVVFELTPNGDGTWQEHILHRFHGSDGVYVSSGVVFDKTGNLYGTAAEGGLGAGTVFKLSPSKGGRWRESTVHRFDGTHGGGPSGGLTFDAHGNLYGTTFGGGIGQVCPTGCGVVYKLLPRNNGTWRYTVLYEFTGTTDGGEPDAGVILDRSGRIYGTNTESASGGGVVFEITP